MGIGQKVKNFLSGKAKRPDLGSHSESSSPCKLDDLAEKMGEMRGDNVSISEGKGNFAPNRNGIESMTKAARDGRIVDRSGEDRAISDLSGYRSIDDK